MQCAAHAARSAQRATSAREVCFAVSRSSSAWRSFIGRSRTARSSRSLPSCRMGRPRRPRCARGTASSLSRGSCCSGTPQRNRARQPTRCPALGGHVACGARSPSRGQLPQLVGHRGQTEPTGPTPACASMRSSVHAHVCRHARGRARTHRNTHIHAPARTQECTARTHTGARTRIRAYMHARMRIYASRCSAAAASLAGPGWGTHP